MFRIATGLLTLIIFTQQALSVQAYAISRSDYAKLGIDHFDEGASSCAASTSAPAIDNNPLHVLNYPAIEDETAAINSINKWIDYRGRGKSPFAGMGSHFIASGKRNNVNPFLAVAHLTKESGLASTPGNNSWTYNSYSTKQGAMDQTPSLKIPTHNSFGASGLSPTPAYYKQYKKDGTIKIWNVYAWPSWVGSIDSTDANYPDWFYKIRNNRYYTNDFATNNLNSYFLTYSGQSSTYAASMLSIMDTIAVGTKINGTGTSSSTTSVTTYNNCSTENSSTVSSDGYVFPLEPQTKSGVGGIKINQIVPTHEPGPAFDLFSVKDSASVYSIYNGVIDFIEPKYGGVDGCIGMQLRADDGYYYAFNHLKNPQVSKGTRVKAGQKIAEIADRSFGKACHGSAPHLHIDRGCTIDGKPQFAGRPECRDPAFIPLLSQVYGRLP